jgi:hypothetical protein
MGLFGSPDPPPVQIPPPQAPLQAADRSAEELARLRRDRDRRRRGAASLRIDQPQPASTGTGLRIPTNY